MGIYAEFTIYLTVLLLFFCLVMVVIAVFCNIVKRIDEKRKINPKIMKWVDIFDWFHEEENDE